MRTLSRWTSPTLYLVPRNFGGYLVVILAGTEEAQRAEAALVAGGFAPRDLKLYTGKQILANDEEYRGRRGIASKMVGSVADDHEGRELYLGYAREGRCALWLRLPDEADVRKALHVLADYNYLHTRYYGGEQQTDFHSPDPDRDGIECRRPGSRPVPF